MRVILPNIQQIEGFHQPIADTLCRMTAAIQTGWGKQHQGDGSHGNVTATGLSVSGLTVLGKTRLSPCIWSDDGVAGDHNDISSPTLKDVSWLRIFPAQSLGGDLDITGIDATGRELGDLLLVSNVASEGGGNDVVFHLEDTASAAANRFLYMSRSPATTFRLEAGRGVWLVYDVFFASVTASPSPRWRILDQA